MRAGEPALLQALQTLGGGGVEEARPPVQHGGLAQPLRAAGPPGREPQRPPGARLRRDRVLEGPAVQRGAPDPREGLAADGADRAALVHGAEPAALARVLLPLGLLRLRGRAPLGLGRPRGGGGRLLADRPKPEERRPHDEVSVAHPLGDGLHPAAGLCTALPLLQQRAPPVEGVVVSAELLPRAEAEARRGALEGKLVEEASQHDVDGRLHLQVAEGVGDALGQVYAPAAAAQVLLEEEDQLHQEKDLTGR
mmetsp:Transcript_36042/g.107722  ORF Transcript_36042/g.107722 Transcript_36042/m.107722 type:complete len:252 (-) Transcript_36042:1153-1908(-)